MSAARTPRGMPIGHRSTVPEVTFCAAAVARASARAQHAGMGTPLASRLDPMTLAGLVTIAVIGLTLRWLPAAAWPLAYGLLLAFAALMVLQPRLERRDRRLHDLALLAMGAIALGLLWRHPRGGALPILTVIWAAMLAGAWPAWRVAAALAVANLAGWWILRGAGYSQPLMSVLLYACFQLFAVLTIHYARRAEDARDRLSATNAELLATRALLAQSARDGERLRVARELHDVAGHKLTALRLNLRAMHAEAPSEQLALVERLSAELLADIRGVVHALRDTDGLDIDTALRALAAPFPRPQLRLALGPGVAITEPQRAEAVLRTVQEALTNAARHGQARVLDVRLDCADGGLRLRIEDDGQVAWPLREGHGLTGMRERLDALGGRLDVERAAGGGLRLQALLPA